MPSTPQQIDFSQSFSPRQQPTYGTIPNTVWTSKGAGMTNLYEESRPEGLYAVRRSGLDYLQNDGGFSQFAQGGGWSLDIINRTQPFIVFGGTTPAMYASAGVSAPLTGPTFSYRDWYTVTGAIPGGLYTGIMTSLQGMWGISNSGAGPSASYIAGAPNNKCLGVAFLDGTTYIMSYNDNQIHGSALQDPTTWPALNIIGASTSWGPGTTVSRHLNYILGFYRLGLQVYYDAGLAPPGSPLAPLPNASFLVGCVTPASVVSMADTTIFVGLTAANNFSVYQLSGLSLTIISDPAVDSILKDYQLAITTIPGARPICTAFSYTDKGHVIYALKIEGVICLIYDTSTQKWNRLTTKTAGVVVPFTGSCGQYGMIGTVNGEVQQWNQLSQVDTIAGGVTQPINCVVETTIMDFRSAYKKFVHKFSCYGDTIPSTMTVEYSDDDYTTYSAAIPIDLSKQRKMVNRQGSFYNRSYRFVYEGTSPFRMRAFELLLEGGTT